MEILYSFFRQFENIHIDPRLLVALGASLVLAIIILIFGKRARGSLRKSDRERVANMWHEVTKNIQHDEAHWRTAIIRADAVLDRALRARGFPGQTMAERMNRAARTYPAIEDAFKAHRLRNDLAHNPMRGISEKETRWALHVFERALRALGM